MALLSNVKVRWANIIRPNTTFDPDGEWSIECILSPKQVEEIQAEAKLLFPKGIKLKVDEETGEKYIKFKRKVLRKDKNGGEVKNPQPVVCGPKGKSDTWTALVGNGSICNVQYGFVLYDNKFGKGLTSDLKGVQVIEHVPYGVQDGDEFGDVEGESTVPSQKDDNSFDDDDFN